MHSAGLLGDSDFELSDVEWTWFRDRVLAPFVVGPLTLAHPGWPGYDEGVRIMDADWDVLVVLDACRADVFEERIDTTQFDEYRREVSLGSHSSEWVRRNFGEGSFGDTVYVSANPHTNLIANDKFHRIFELWDTHYDEALGTVPPDAVAEQAITVGSDYPDKRLIVHFMQPHGPLIGVETSRPFDSDEAYWHAYRATLDHVFPYAMDVARKISGRAVITADHGQINHDGLFKHLGLKSHKPRLRLPGLVYVPWAVLDGDRRKVKAGETTSGRQTNVDDRLRDLGYKA